MSALTLSSTKFNPGKLSSVKPDSDGYYRLPGGALNAYNQSGDLYIMDNSVKKAFGPTSSMMKRLNVGQLRSEIGHPPVKKDMTKSEIFSRMLELEESNLCGHIKAVEFEETTIREPGVKDNKILIWIHIKPMGVHSQVLKDDLETANANTAFSIRSFSYDVEENGLWVKRIRIPITFDYVTEAGISSSTKWNSVGIESIDHLRLTGSSDIEMAKKTLERMKNIGNESSNCICDEVGCYLNNMEKKKTTLEDW